MPCTDCQVVYTEYCLPGSWRAAAQHGTNVRALQRAYLRQDNACRWQDKVNKLSSLTLLVGARAEGRRSLHSWQLPAF